MIINRLDLIACVAEYRDIGMTLEEIERLLRPYLLGNAEWRAYMFAAAGAEPTNASLSDVFRIFARLGHQRNP